MSQSPADRQVGSVDINAVAGKSDTFFSETLGLWVSPDDSLAGFPPAPAP